MYIHDTPAVSSEDRMHVLDIDCWCKPTIEKVGPRPGVDGLGVVHQRAEDPNPPVDDEANDAALPEPTEPQGPDVKNDEIEDDNGEAD